MFQHPALTAALQTRIEKAQQEEEEGEGGKEEEEEKDGADVKRRDGHADAQDMVPGARALYRTTKGWPAPPPLVDVPRSEGVS